MPELVSISSEILWGVALATVWCHFEDSQLERTEVYFSIPRMSGRLVVREDGTFYVCFKGKNGDTTLIETFRRMEYS
jgi:hypothetical protein